MPLQAKPHHGVPIARTADGKEVFADFNLQEYLDEIERSPETLLEIDLSGQSAEAIKSLYESNPDTNAFTNALLNKLNQIEAGAEVNPSDAEIKTASGFTQDLEDKLNELDADAVLTKQIDIVADSPSAGETTYYKGLADPATATSSALWRIERLIERTDGDIEGTWADGDVNFDNIWDDRVSLSYS